jgi:hypothetical protein
MNTVKKNLPQTITYLNGIILFIYTAVFIGSMLQFYDIWSNSITDVFSDIMLWSILAPGNINAGLQTRTFFAVLFLAVQWLFPIVTSIIGIVLNRKYIMIHTALILVCIASVTIIFLRGIYVNILV